MATENDGSLTCDRCGRTLPDDSLLHSLRVVGLSATFEAVTLHICTMKPDPCASHVLTKRALANLGDTPEWHNEEIISDDTAGPAAEPSNASD